MEKYKKGTREYYENYARLSLINLIEYKEDDLMLKDRPDIQSESLDIGIEVVLGGTKQDNMAAAITVNYFPNEFNEEEFKARIKKHFPDFKGEVGRFDNVAWVSTLNQTYRYENDEILTNTGIYINSIIDTINNKITKFSNYKKFKTNGLYIFVQHSFLDNNDIFTIIKEIQNNQFDVLYFNLIDRLLVYKDNKIIEYQIPNDLLLKLDRCAQKYN